MIAGAVILALLMAVLALPAAALVRYEDGALSLRLRVGPMTVPLYPPRPKGPSRRAGSRKPPEKPAAQAAPAGPKKLSRRQIGVLVRVARTILGRLRRKLLVRRLIFRIRFGGRDAAQAAIGYGRAWAVIGAVMPVLENLLRIGDRDVGADLDYGLEQPQLLLDLDVRLRVGTALVLALQAAFLLLKELTQSKQTTKKAVQVNEPSSL